MQGRKRDTDVEHRLVDTDGEGEVGRMESSVDTCTLPYGKEETRGNLLYDAGSSTRCSVTTRRDGMGWEVGQRFKR